MGSWSKRVILVCGVVAVGCGGKDSTPSGMDAGLDQGSAEVRSDACVPDCDGKECGDDGCGGICGECPDDGCNPPSCNGSTCEWLCLPQCDGKECGDDGCGCSCGECGVHEKCGEQGECIAVCVPDCKGKECGPDGCGGQCGECATESVFDCECIEGRCCPFAATLKGQAQRMVDMAWSFDAGPGGGLDVDGDPATCAPPGECSDGIDNGVAALEPLILQEFGGVDWPMSGMKAKGEFPLLVPNYAPKWDLSGELFSFAMAMGKDDPDGEGCDWQAGKCTCCILLDSFNHATITYLVSFHNALVMDGVLTAGGPDAIFSVAIPFQEGIALTVVTACMVQIVGTITGDGESMAITDGIIGGAVRKDKLMELVDYMPEDLLSGEEKTVMKEALDTLAIPDMDTDEDGEKDAMSFAFHFSTLPGTSVGLCPEW